MIGSGRLRCIAGFKILQMIRKRSISIVSILEEPHSSGGKVRRRRTSVQKVKLFLLGMNLLLRKKTILSIRLHTSSHDGLEKFKAR